MPLTRHPVSMPQSADSDSSPDTIGHRREGAQLWIGRISPISPICRIVRRKVTTQYAGCLRLHFPTAESGAREVGGDNLVVRVQLGQGIKERAFVCGISVAQDR